MEGASGVFMPWVHGLWVPGLGVYREMRQYSWWAALSPFCNYSSGGRGSEFQVNRPNR